MPSYGNPGSAAPDPYTDEAPAGPETESETTAPEEDAENEPTAELPKSVLGGKEFKPGEEVVLQIVQVMENSVLVKYATEEGGGGEYGGEEASAPAAETGGGGGGSMYD